MSYKSKLELQRSDDGTLGVRLQAEETLAERQVKLLESIDTKLSDILNASRREAQVASRRGVI